MLNKQTRLNEVQKQRDRKRAQQTEQQLSCINIIIMIITITMYSQKVCTFAEHICGKCMRTGKKMYALCTNTIHTQHTISSYNFLLSYSVYYYCYYYILFQVLCVCKCVYCGRRFSSWMKLLPLATLELMVYKYPASTRYLFSLAWYVLHITEKHLNG